MKTFIISIFMAVSFTTFAKSKILLEIQDYSLSADAYFAKKKNRKTKELTPYISLIQRDTDMDGGTDLTETRIHLEGLKYNSKVREYSLVQNEGPLLFCGKESDKYLFNNKKKKKGFIKTGVKVSYSSECYLKVEYFEKEITKRNGKKKMRRFLRVLLITEKE